MLPTRGAEADGDDAVIEHDGKDGRHTFDVPEGAWDKELGIVDTRGLKCKVCGLDAKVIFGDQPQFTEKWFDKETDSTP